MGNKKVSSSKGSPEHDEDPHEGVYDPPKEKRKPASNPPSWNTMDLSVFSGTELCRIPADLFPLLRHYGPR